MCSLLLFAISKQTPGKHPWHRQSVGKNSIGRIPSCWINSCRTNSEWSGTRRANTPRASFSPGSSKPFATRKPIRPYFGKWASWACWAPLLTAMAAPAWTIFPTDWLPGKLSEWTLAIAP